MIQCFVKKEYEAPFGLTQMPRRHIRALCTRMMI